MTRLKLRSQGRRKAPLAVFTMVRDEAEMLPRWLAYYGDQVGHDHLVVIDHGTTDGSTAGLPCRVIRQGDFRGAFEPARMRLISKVGRSLLRTHEAVLFADADEFLIADPERYEGLVHYLAANPAFTVTGGLGFNLVHRTDREGPLRADEPVLGQRRHGFFVQRLCKPSLRRVGAGWRNASHGVDVPYRPDPALLFLHLKYADADLLRRIGDHRLALHPTTGLTERSAWAKSGEEQVRQLAELAVGPDEPPYFDPTIHDPATLVTTRDEGVWEPNGLRELVAMQEGPLLQLPPKYFGLV